MASQWYVAYTDFGGLPCYTNLKTTKEEAEQDAAKLDPSCYPKVRELTSEQIHEPQRCSRCGTPVVMDLFWLWYCPNCRY